MFFELVGWEPWALDDWRGDGDGGWGGLVMEVEVEAGGLGLRLVSEGRDIVTSFPSF